MNTLSYKTVSANSKTVTKEWVVIDANAEILGRLSSKIAFILRGKHKANFTPHVDCGDNVIVINADKVVFTGTKIDYKEYQNVSGYPGGQRIEIAKDLLKRRPEQIMERAIKGMLPKNRLGRRLFTNLFVYEGTEHPHAAQQPKVMNTEN